MNDPMTIKDIAGFLAGWLIIGVISTMLIWCELGIFSSKPVPLTAKALIIGSVCGLGTSALAGLLLPIAGIKLVIEASDKCLAHCE